VQTDGSEHLKEHSGKIELDDQEPILVKKTLEFLYTGDYTLDMYERTSRNLDEDKTADPEQTPGEEPLQEVIPFPEEESPLAEDPTDAPTEAFPEHAVDIGLAEEAPAEPEGEQPAYSLSATEDAVPSGPNLSTGLLTTVGARTMSYFHILMYAQAYYFQIDGLKARAKKYFRASFVDQLDKESLYAVVVEVYRSTTEYDRGLSDLVVELTLDNLPALRSGKSPILDNDLLRLIPEFATDLCIATLDKYYHNNEDGWH
jgi:hypothetical protein